MRRQLDRRGHEVLTATSGITAIRACYNHDSRDLFNLAMNAQSAAEAHLALNLLVGDVPERSLVAAVNLREVLGELPASPPWSCLCRTRLRASAIPSLRSDATWRMILPASPAGKGKRPPAARKNPPNASRNPCGAERADFSDRGCPVELGAWQDRTVWRASPCYSRGSASLCPAGDPARVPGWAARTFGGMFAVTPQREAASKVGAVHAVFG